MLRKKSFFFSLPQNRLFPKHLLPYSETCETWDLNSSAGTRMQCLVNARMDCHIIWKTKVLVQHKAIQWGINRFPSRSPNRGIQCIHNLYTHLVLLWRDVKSCRYAFQLHFFSLCIKGISKYIYPYVSGPKIFSIGSSLDLQDHWL